MTVPLLPGTLYLIDTSVMARLAHKPVRDIVAGIIDLGIAATCVTVELEAGYSARDAGELAKVFKVRDEFFVPLPLTEACAERARQVQLLLARRGLHRAAGVVDLLTAAVAEQHRAIILHYDADFESIASVTGQQQQWITPRGSI